MRGRPDVLIDHRPRRPKVSVILIDWGVRESFHSLQYFNRQTVPRDDYELIWVEFYDHRPEPLRRLATAPGRPALDKWLVLGYPPDLIYHKHRLYNAGLLAAAGDVCVICDSDAIIRPTFVESLLRAFAERPYAVVHLDEVRNADRRFYPFNYPSIDEVLGAGAMNWWEWTTEGLFSDRDRLHRANYGACMAARRDELLRVGGADEHPDYLGFCCGPYEMTFRLGSRGRREWWLYSEYLYHTWHPNCTMFNTEYHAPHDGRFIPLRALHARATGRVTPYRPNPHVRPGGLAEFLRAVAEQDEPDWVVGRQPADPPDFVYQADRDYRGYDLFVHRGEWFALPAGTGRARQERAVRDGHPALLRAENERLLRAHVGARRPWSPERPTVGPIRRLTGDVLAQPLHRLPGRAWRTVRRLARSR